MAGCYEYKIGDGGRLAMAGKGMGWGRGTLNQREAMTYNAQRMLDTNELKRNEIIV